MINFRCSSCGTAFQTEDTSAGSSLNCGKCGALVMVPRRARASDPWLRIAFNTLAAFSLAALMLVLVGLFLGANTELVATPAITAAIVCPASWVVFVIVVVVLRILQI